MHQPPPQGFSSNIQREYEEEGNISNQSLDIPETNRELSYVEPIRLKVPSYMKNNSNSPCNTDKTFAHEGNTAIINNSAVIIGDPPQSRPRKTLFQVKKEKKKTKKHLCKIFCIGLMATIYVNYIYIYWLL